MEYRVAYTVLQEIANLQISTRCLITEHHVPYSA